MSDPLLESLTPEEISQALLQFVLRRNGHTKAAGQALISYPKNAAPPLCAAVYVVPADAEPAPPAGPPALPKS